MPEDQEPAAAVGTPPAPDERRRDPLTDTMPWTFDDDPAIAQLRAWRDELESPDAAEPATDGPAHGQASAETAPEAAPAEAPGTAAITEERRAVPRRTPGTGAWPVPMLGGVRQRAPDPEATLVDRGLPDQPRTLPAGRHARWDVVAGETSAEPEPETVAFPSLEDFVDTDDRALAIEATDLRKSFGDMTAVDGVSFSVREGKILALLGPNGAGKTTIVNMLTTLLRPDSGTATVAGHDVGKDPAGVRRSIMLTGQFAALDEALTGRENLVMFGRLLGLRKAAAKKRAEELLAMFGLEYAADRKVRQYSGGMRRRIDIACGLVTEPKVVFLDEPTTGLDPRSRQDVWTLVEQLRDAGVTVLLTTQYLEEADMLSDNIVVIDHGKVIAEGTSDELKAQTGAAYCEITPSHPAYLPRLRAKLTEQLGLEVSEENDRISVPAPQGAETLAQVIACTERAKIPLSDISLRRPSLDEVFIALTDAEHR